MKTYDITRVANQEPAPEQHLGRVAAESPQDALDRVDGLYECDELHHLQAREAPADEEATCDQIS